MYVADLHIHSKYSRATSANCDLAHLDLWARRKGIALLGTGDFTHPAWRSEIQEQLVPAEDGLYRLREERRLPDFCPPGETPRFVLSGEISCIYKKDGRVRKVHNVILLPDVDAAERLSAKLEAIGNIRSDGRPILGLDSRDLLAITLDVCPEAIFVPAHIWTPHFSLFGAFSGFETTEECFGDLTPYIRAMETGLSSDPPMNWRVPMLDGITLISNSDAHSPAKLAREANLLDAPLSFSGLKRALETGEGFCGTVEFFPEEGKYHLDGHRNCSLRITPEETRAYGGRCPVCGKKITIGVLNRVEQLAVRPQGAAPEKAKPFEHLMPLPEVIGASLGISAAGNKAQLLYEQLLRKLGPELDILRTLPLADIELAAGDTLAEGIRRLRAGKVECLGGYDGEYGTVSLFRPEELERLRGQICFLAETSAVKKKRPPAAAVKAERQEARETPAAVSRNEEQERAVAASCRVVAVVAGPGTGKTHTLVERAAYLVQSGIASPSEMTCVTFTNQAAAEMRQRLSAVLKRGSADRMTIGTFHAICLDLLSREGDVTVIDRGEALALAAEVLHERKMRVSPLRFLQNVSAVKNGVLEPDAFQEAYEAYNARLAELHALDFDDLLLTALQRGNACEKQFRYLLADEFQDINDLQYRLLKNWSAEGESLFVIGDPDQSIYGFRGADADCFRRLQSDFPQAEEIRLLQNYRSTPQILLPSLAVISHNPGPARTLSPVRPGGPKIRLVETASDLSEGIFVAKEIGRMTGGLDMLEAASARGGEVARSFSEIAVLCRTHRHAALLESCLQKESIPCLVAGREDYLNEPEVRGTLGFFRSLYNVSDAPSLRSALILLWNVAPKEADSAAAFAAQAENAAAAADALSAAPHLAGWAEQARVYCEAVNKKKPKKLLESWQEERHLTSPAFEQLKKAASLYDDMTAFLNDLLLGAESDVRRGSKTAYAPDSVRLLTLHGAKGLEFSVVFLCGFTEGAIPLLSEHSSTDIEEERRLFFVGMTRAKEELILVSPGEPSPFLKELPEGSYTKEQAGKKPNASKQLSMF